MPEHTDCGDIRVQLREDRAGVIAFNRPERLNAVTGQTFADLERALRRLGDRTDCGAVVITGSGRAFCAGMDLDTPSGNGEQATVQAAYGALRSGVAAVIALREIPQPVIAPRCMATQWAWDSHSPPRPTSESALPMHSSAHHS